MPNYLFGQQPFAKEFAERYNLPLIAGVGGAESIYPEFIAKLKTATDAEALARMKARARPQEREPAVRVDPEPHDGEIHVCRCSNNVYLLAGDGGNIVVQVGDQGALVVDTGSGALADKTTAAIGKLFGDAGAIHCEYRVSPGPHRR